jgi:hypothetical protein
MYVLYEVYNPAAGGKDAGPRVLTSIELLAGARKVFETPLAQGTRLTDAARHAIAFRVDIPLAGIPPGPYTCQVNVIDDRAGAFTFPRIGLLIR